MPESKHLAHRTTKLPREFYLRPTLEIAKELLGKILVRTYHGKILSGKIVEVEAYLGAADHAAHSYRGATARNEAMFKTGGHLYVYFIYGMHYCANVVTEDAGIGHACLIRAIEPIEGLEIMRSRRNVKRDTDLTNGPAKLCAALAITKKDNGKDLCGDEIFLCDAPAVENKNIGVSTRIGISRAKEKKWRFFLKDNLCVSKPH